MSAGDRHPPATVLATDDAGAARIDALLARRRSELARLTLSARAATLAVERAEAALEDQRMGLEGETVPADLLGVVDGMIERAVRARDEALDAARRNADETVAAAVAEGVELLRRSGVDPTRLPAARRPGAAPVAVSAPPTATELWRVTVPVSRSTTTTTTGPRTVVPSTPVGPPDPPTPPPSAAAVVVPTSSLPAPDGVERFSASPVATVVLDTPASASFDDCDAQVLAPLVDPLEGSAEVFDMFWQEAGRERRVRDRLRRRSKEGS